jgi:SAM-dependent methyltransferase
MSVGVLPVADATAINRAFYDDLWRRVRWQPPQRFNTWPLMRRLCDGTTRRLEIGPGMRPRLPLAGTTFIDLSAGAVEGLRARGAQAEVGNADHLAFPDGHFELVCAFDIVEHVADDRQVFAELTRVLAPGGILLLSVPLHPERWTPFDALCGHVRRYRIEEIGAHLREHRLEIEQSAGFGMQPRQWLVDLGMFFLRAMPRRSMFIYNYLVMPLALRLQAPLAIDAGDVAMTNGHHDEVLLVCRSPAAAC